MTGYVSHILCFHVYEGGVSTHKIGDDVQSRGCHGQSDTFHKSGFSDAGLQHYSKSVRAKFYIENAEHLQRFSPKSGQPMKAVHMA